MASVAFKKCKGGTAAAAFSIKHVLRYGDYLGLAGDDTHYANGYVDKTKSIENYKIGQRPGHSITENDPDAVYEHLKRRVELIDKVRPPKRVRKDRVTFIECTVTTPRDGMSRDEERRFFQVAYDEICRFYGGRNNVTAGYVHHDEVHDYIDAATGRRRTSRPHMHVIGIPYVTDKGINGKLFETRGRMRDLNKAIDERCLKELGIPFMTYDRARSGRTVEELQAASETRALQQAREEKERQISTLTARESALKKSNMQLDRRANELKGEVVSVQQELGDLRYIRTVLLHEIEQLERLQKRSPAKMERYEAYALFRHCCEEHKLFSFGRNGWDRFFDIYGAAPSAASRAADWCHVSPAYSDKPFTWNGKECLIRSVRDGVWEPQQGAVFRPELRDLQPCERKPVEETKSLSARIKALREAVAAIDRHTPSLTSPRGRAR